MNRLVGVIALALGSAIAIGALAAPLAALADALVPLVVVSAVGFCLIRAVLYMTERR